MSHQEMTPEERIRAAGAARELPWRVLARLSNEISKEVLKALGPLRGLPPTTVRISALDLEVRIEEGFWEISYPGISLSWRWGKPGDAELQDLKVGGPPGSPPDPHGKWLQVLETHILFQLRRIAIFLADDVLSAQEFVHKFIERRNP